MAGKSGYLVLIGVAAAISFFVSMFFALLVKQTLDGVFTDDYIMLIMIGLVVMFSVMLTSAIYNTFLRERVQWYY